MSGQKALKNETKMIENEFDSNRFCSVAIFFYVVFGILTWYLVI